MALAVGLMLGQPTGALAEPLDVVGSFDPGTPGLNATAVGLDGFAYLGSWGGPSQCPSLGVRVLDVREPTAPALLGSAAAYTGTTAEHVAAVRYATTAFTGNVLFVGIQRCVASSGATSGLAIWDVTDPSNPAELGFFSTGHAPRGVHEFTVGQRPTPRSAMAPATCASSTSPIRVNRSVSSIGVQSVTRAYLWAAVTSARRFAAAPCRRHSCTA
jgi:hypothetical protein